MATENSLQRAEINSKNTLIYSLIIIFILAVGIALVWYIAHNRAVKQKHRIQLGQQKIEAQEQIIREVSSMLHTDMGGVLSGLIINLQNKDPENKLQEESKQLQGIYNRIRKMSHILALPSFVQSNIEDEINSLINNIKIKGLEVNTEIYSAKGWKDVDSKMQQTIYRIAQELFTNSLKHAKASRIDIQISRTDNQIFLVYEDNGIGYDPEKINKNLGYKTEIEERTLLINGELSDNSRPGHGTSIMISCPVKTND
ncbi:MAG: ATP-binding protein [Bacteroidota bacterium]|nr:ATP-binding protein [Bacteroidota bacterium]